MDSRTHPVAETTSEDSTNAASVIRRRAFLIGAGASLVVTACGRGATRAAPTPSPRARGLVFVPAAVELAVGDERLAFGVFRNDVPLPYTRDVSGLVAMRSPTGREQKPVRVRTFPIVRSKGGEDAERASERATLVLVGRVEFDAPGRWDAVARLDIGGRREVAVGPIDVLEQSRTVGIDGKAIEFATPTTGDARGVDPICTRIPPCTMHDVSLDAALGNGKPSVVVFATPALCMSRMCGPDVDVVEKVHLARPGEANFVHVEIYRNLGGTEVAPATAAWSIDKAGEPWVFFVSADGKVTDRLSGPVGEWEVDKGVDLLARG
ncbi:MAG: hypothetical protein ACRDKJ_05980 [Actinomycetota bacterium]